MRNGKDIWIFDLRVPCCVISCSLDVKAHCELVNNCFFTELHTHTCVTLKVSCVVVVRVLMCRYNGKEGYNDDDDDSNGNVGKW